MKNILFSTTRQWNVGDEFILFGAINILKEVFPEGINPIIYNRHPDLRTNLYPPYELQSIKLGEEYGLSLETEASFRIGFRDNSFKKTTDGGFIDLVVFAGSPEWSNDRCFDLYKTIETYNLPAVALGIGNNVQSNCDLIMKNLDKFKLFTVRAPEFVDLLSPYITPPPRYLPCPALCSAPKDKIRSVDNVKNIALVYACDGNRSEVNNCVSSETYNYMQELYREIRSEFAEYNISIVCHYIDELPYAHSDFPELNILYSFDSKDYYDIYNQFDLVIGARVHGVGCAASMGIPGVCISHDFRGQTARGFLAEVIDTKTSLKQAIEIVRRCISQIDQKSLKLKEHIAATKNTYVKLLKETIELDEKDYKKYCPPEQLRTKDMFADIPPLRGAVRELMSAPKSVEECDNLREEIDKIKNSLSWRVTAPLRKLAAFFRKQF